MLPTLNLQLGELLKFDNTLNNMDLLPQDAVVPDAAFGDLLELRLNAPPIVEFQSGDGLPAGGNALPQTTLELPLSTDVLSEAESEPGVAVPEPVQSDRRQLVSDTPVPAVEFPALPVTARENLDESRLAIDETPTVAAVALNLALDVSPGRSADSAPVVASPVPNGAIATNAPRIDPVQARGADMAMMDAQVLRQPPVASAPPDRAVDVELPAATPVVIRKPAVTAGPVRVAGQPALAPSPASPASIDVPRTETQQSGPLLRDVDAQAPRPAVVRSDGEPTARASVRGPAPDIAPVAATTVDDSMARSVEFKGGDDVQMTKPLQPLLQTTVQPTSRQPLVQPGGNPLSPTAFAVETPVHDTAWGERVGERVLLMASNQLKSAEIRLSPAELGPLRVQVSVDDGAANVTFHAYHAATRDAIEQALPRLRDMFVENGLSLGQTNVGDQSVAQQGNANRDGHGAQAADGAAEENPATVGDESMIVSTNSAASDSLVDTYV